MIVRFYDHIDDQLLKFAVILAKYGGKWVFCKHQARNTYEFPGGHREPGETILTSAERELREETGAVDFELSPICVYSVTGSNSVNRSGEETFGMLYFADIQTFEPELHSEIERIQLFDALPKALTYPLIQPALFEEYLLRTGACNGINLYIFWQSVLCQDAPALAEYFHPNAIVNWHCTNERFTADEFITVNCAYPGQWEGQMERLERSGDLFITVVHVYPSDRSASFHVTSFFCIEDGKILSLDEYWANDGPPPTWRKALHSGIAIQP